MCLCVGLKEREKQGWQDGQGENAAAGCDVSALI